jgi:hypothetical protein
MPNWCEVELIIERASSGWVSQAQRQTQWEIWRKLFDAIFRFNYLDSETDIEPFDILRPTPQSESDNWYDWRMENWGTKWDIKSACTQFNGDSAYNATEVIISGSCAWCPPDTLVDYLRDLGFGVECNHFSIENASWGTDIDQCFHIRHQWIDEDDEDDDTALVLYEKFGVDEISEDELAELILGECIRCQPQFIKDQVQYIVDDILERYEDWKDNFSDKISNIKEKRNKVMELVDRRLEDGRFNEGLYLELCNMLKDGNIYVVLNICIDQYYDTDITDYLKIYDSESRCE